MPERSEGPSTRNETNCVRLVGLPALTIFTRTVTSVFLPFDTLSRDDASLHTPRNFVQSSDKTWKQFNLKSQRLSNWSLHKEHCRLGYLKA